MSSPNINATIHPKELDITPMAVAVALSWTGNQASDNAAGITCVKLPARPLQN